MTTAAATTPAPRAEAAPAAMLRPGRNCWRVEPADRLACIQDAADYFRLVRTALLAAKKTIFILGWDIWAHLDLLPGERTSAPSRLDKLLAFIARRRPGLRCYILIWDYGALYSLERDPLTRWRLGWRTPRGVRFGFDEHHPIGASHHQKVVVVDDQLAFCGGIDLTGHRWDTSAHSVEEPRRATALGLAYGPYHEVQAMATGSVAAALGELARGRWRALGLHTRPFAPSTEDLWPDDVEPDLRDARVGIARTMPASETQPAIRECEALFLDSIAGARRSIYIENQYFTNEAIAAALAARLREPDGPEVIVVEPRDCHGWLEQNTMGAFRGRAHRALHEADVHKRLRLVHPLSSRADDVSTFVHSKVMVIDDTLARIGSANLSQRSMGMDSECDLAVEASRDARHRAGILRIRDRLLAEHFGVRLETIHDEIERAGSIRAVVDARAGESHTLDPIVISPEPESEEPSPLLRAAADPEEPMAFGTGVETLIPPVDVRRGRDPLRIWILPAVALVAAGILAWASTRALRSEMVTLRDTMLALPADPAALWAGAIGFLLAGLALVPLELLAILAGLLFGAATGGVIAFLGSCAAAAVGYSAGRIIGPSRLSSWISARAYRSVRQLGARGLGGVLALRLAGLAGAGAIHLLCGAGRVPVAPYLAGTALGFVPLIAALSGLGALLRHTILYPSIMFAALTIGAALLLMGLLWGLRALFVMRQFAPTMSRHRQRAEFG